MQSPVVRARFIPVPKAELVARLTDSEMVATGERALFEQFGHLLDSLFHFEFQARVEALKDSYRPFNPDSDLLVTREVNPEERGMEEARLMSVFKAVLNQANYEQITEAKLKRLGLCRIAGHDPTGASLWQALPLADAFRCLDQRWKRFFRCLQ